MLMIRSKWLEDLIMVQQFQRISGILCKNEIGFFEHFQSAEGNILQVADGGRNNVQQMSKFGNERV